jgi:hypothetical protein
MKTEDKITSYLGEQEEVMMGGTEQLNYLEDDELLEKMYDLITSLDPNKLSELQAEELVGIIDDIAGDDEDEELEEVKRVRISPAAKRERKKQYKKNRNKLKIKAKRYRKTAGYKKYKKKTKRMSRSGKTSTGKLVRKFI